MFTGIVEAMGVLAGTEVEGGNVKLTVKCAFVNEIKVDQSIAHNGVCLTVMEIGADSYSVVAVAETLQKTNMGTLKKGAHINLERSLRVGDRLDGHFVQGHVDTTGICSERREADGSWIFMISFPVRFAPLVIEKGSICVNGVSLTAFNVGNDCFTVTIIPYTYTHTQFCDLVIGDSVNLEFDVLGKYMLRSMNH